MYKYIYVRKKNLKNFLIKKKIKIEVKKNKTSRLFYRLSQEFFFKKTLILKSHSGKFKSYNKFSLVLKKKRLFQKKSIFIKLNSLFTKKVLPHHAYNILFFINFTTFRSNTYNIYVRHNFNLNLYVFIKNNVEFLFNINAFPKFYLNKLIDSFTFMCFTKTINLFSTFIRKLISRLSRIGQKNFFFSFGCVDYSNMTVFFKKLFIFGFFLKSTGKIAGYVADRTKTFYVRFGNCSRSMKLFKYFYKQTLSITRSGSIGSNFLLIFK